jgi:hypothetical protein
MGTSILFYRAGFYAQYGVNGAPADECCRNKYASQNSQYDTQSSGGYPGEIQYSKNDTEYDPENFVDASEILGHVEDFSV